MATASEAVVGAGGQEEAFSAAVRIFLRRFFDFSHLGISGTC
jgi:hypothetical protein